MRPNIDDGLTPVQALNGQTWVSGHRKDRGAYGTVAAPCRTFAFALTQTAAGGEIDVLDPADYGKATIAKAISIVNDGVGTTGIDAASGAHGVMINADASDSVRLRGLTIEGLGSGSIGIQFNSGGNFAIETCVVRNITGGIFISPSASSSFSVSNTIASNNGAIGILVQPTGSAAVTGVLSQVTANNNNDGILVVGGPPTGAKLNVTIVDSVASNNRNQGVGADSIPGKRHSIQLRRQRHQRKREQQYGSSNPARHALTSANAPKERLRRSAATRRVRPGGDCRLPKPGRTRLSASADDFGIAHLLGFVKF